MIEKLTNHKHKVNVTEVQKKKKMHGTFYYKRLLMIRENKSDQI